MRLNKTSIEADIHSPKVSRFCHSFDLYEVVLNSPWNPWSSLVCWFLSGLFLRRTNLLNHPGSVSCLYCNIACPSLLFWSFVQDSVNTQTKYFQVLSVEYLLLVIIEISCPIFLQIYCCLPFSSPTFFYFQFFCQSSIYCWL